jgi:ankyrin repeat protein
VEKEDKAMVKLLLEKGAMPDYEDGHGRSPLSAAKQNGNMGIINMLEGIENFDTINGRD